MNRERLWERLTNKMVRVLTRSRAFEGRLVGMDDVGIWLQDDQGQMSFTSYAVIDRLYLAPEEK